MSTDETTVEAPELRRKGDEVFLGDEAVAKLEGDELKIKRGYGKHKDAIEALLAPVSVETPASPAPATSAVSAQPQPIIVQATPEGIVEEARREAEKYRDDVADDVSFAKKNGIEAPPPKNPQFGDKTPAYVEWLRTHRPDKYEAKFRVERTDQRVPIYGDDGEVTHHETKDVGGRKTHLSEKIERDPALDDSMSWDA